MGRRAKPKEDLDTELADLPAELRWREWMGRVEAVIFASPEPVTRDLLARVVGRNCSIDLIIEDIREELRGRPYELVSVAGGWQHRTRKSFAETIRAAIGARGDGKALSQSETLILACIAYYQPITRRELSSFFGKEISRDTIGRLRGLEFIAAGPRSPQPGAPYTYVTTKPFLSHFGLDTLRDLPDMEMLEEAGLLSKVKLLAGDLPDLLPGDDEIEDDESTVDQADTGQAQLSNAGRRIDIRPLSRASPEASLVGWRPTGEPTWKIWYSLPGARCLRRPSERPRPASDLAPLILGQRPGRRLQLLDTGFYDLDFVLDGLNCLRWTDPGDSLQVCQHFAPMREELAERIPVLYFDVTGHDQLNSFRHGGPRDFARLDQPNAELPKL